jgi:zinc/manganese transport system permease protein
LTGLYDAFVSPFLEFAFMRRALVASLALALGCGPVGVLLVLRRMSLVGDTMAHAVLPGAAVGFLVSGLSLPAMSVGGFVAGFAVALLAGVVSRITDSREDASFASFYLIAVAAGVLIVSTHGSNIDLLHVLFGTVLAVDDAALLMMASIATATLLTLAVICRPLVVECFDPGYLRSAGTWGGVSHLIFLILVVLNLVGGFQALGTLMAVGLMMLPATAARYWTQNLWVMALAATGMAFLSGALGLIVSFHYELPSGPAIILAAGAFYLLSLLLGPQGSVRTRFFPRRHLTA